MLFLFPNIPKDIRELVSLEDVMEEVGLGPNGALMYCMEYLDDSLHDWVDEELDNYRDDDYLIFDCPVANSTMPKQRNLPSPTFDIPNLTSTTWPASLKKSSLTRFEVEKTNLEELTPISVLKESQRWWSWWSFKIAAKERHPAFVHCFLSFKGFLACQAHRIAHKLWTQDRKILAFLIQNREAFAVDFHPGAKIRKGILFDHTTGW
ncbi:hypothetical protein F2Q70_00042621 [Brassica cretica]|uniref:Uncharacterized protein n=1 Tax=Brassica cretica TaxID=69181 RepID=A0A8S9KEX8_BRACR|nr:hypothetical protein F2Q70_00042621 [Brassica cretica]